MKVKLEAFFETGTEGVHWSVYDPTKKGYEGLIPLNEGDKLIIPDVWEGIIQKDREESRAWYHWAGPYARKNQWKEMYLHFTKGYEEPWLAEATEEEIKETCKSMFSQQQAGGMWCHWVQKDVDPDLWCSWFMKELDAEYIPSNELH